MTIQVYQGNQLQLEFTLRDQDGNLLDLTNAAVVFAAKAKLEDDDPIFSHACTIDSPGTLGVARYMLTADDTAAAGLFKAEVRATFPPAVEGQPSTIVTAWQGDLLIVEDVLE